MKPKTRKRLIVLAIVGSLLLYDNIPMPFSLTAFRSQFQHMGKHCDITSGALAHEEGVSYIFQFADGGTHTIGDGSREIEVVETKPINFFWGGVFPFFKHFRVNLGFECFDKNTQNFLGSIEWNGTYTGYGLFSKTNARDNILHLFYNDFNKLRAGREEFVDQVEPSTSNYLVGSFASDWTPRMSKNLLFRDNQMVYDLNRQVTVKNYKDFFRDSIPYSTVGGMPDEVSHEIIELNPKTGAFSYQQFLNSGELKYDFISADAEFREELAQDMSRRVCYPCGGLILEHR